LIDKIHAHVFEVIQVVSLDNHRETGDRHRIASEGINRPFSLDVYDAIIDDYRIEHEDENGAFLVPR
jgi:hypothetical protein